MNPAANPKQKDSENKKETFVPWLPEFGASFIIRRDEW